MIFMVFMVVSALSNGDDNFQTNHKRKKFYKGKFTFVAPRTMPLGTINGKSRWWHYIPLHDTLKALFQNKSFDVDLRLPEDKQDGVLRDFHDGITFKSNDFLKKNQLLTQSDLLVQSTRFWQFT